MKKIFNSKTEFYNTVKFYLKENLPTSLIEEKYELTYNEKKRLKNMIKHFYQTSSVMLSQYDYKSDFEPNIDYIFADFKFEEIEYHRNLNNNLFEQLDDLKGDIKAYYDGSLYADDSIIKELTNEIEKIPESKIKLGKKLKRTLDSHNGEIKKWGIDDPQVRELLSCLELYENLTKKLERRREEIRSTYPEYLELKNKINEVKTELIKVNAHVINKILNESEYLNFPFEREDAYSLGLIGLLNAIDSYDRTGRTSFQNFAFYKVYNSLMRSSKFNIGSLNEFKEHLKNMEMQQQIDLKASKSSIITDDKCIEDVIIKPFTYCIDELYNENQESFILEDYYEDNTLDNLNHSILQKNLKLALDNLSEREKKVMIFLYGLNGITYTQKDFAKIFNVSKNRIWQIKEVALRKLGHMDELSEYSNFPSKQENLIYPEWINKLPTYSLASVICKILYDEIVYVNDLGYFEIEKYTKHYYNIDYSSLSPKEQDELQPAINILNMAPHTYHDIVEELNNPGIHNFHNMREYFNRKYKTGFPIEFFTFFYHHDKEIELLNLKRKVRR